MLAPHPRRIAFSLLTVALVIGGCRQEEEASPAAPAKLSGAITIDGSATLLPVSRAFADAFERLHAGIKVNVSASGTGAGLERLCAGEIDVAAASRPINATEIAACRSRGIGFFELPVAFDSLSIVVSPQNAFAACLTIEELKQMWSPVSQGKARRWNHIRATFPDLPMDLVGPGRGSGTFDYFTLAINGTEGVSRADYTKLDDPASLAQYVGANENAVGYLGFAHYMANREQLKVVAVDNGQGCVSPSADSVTNETYQPLSRPIFVYASAAAVERAEVKAFARFYVSPDNAATVLRIGYVPLPTASLLSIASHLDKNLTGTIFGGRGSVLGVTAAAFEDDERVKNALVR